MTTPLRVLLADDEPMARATLRRLLARDEEVELVGEARHGREAVELVRQLRPDLLLLDVQMPELDGFDVLAELGDEVPPAVVFSTAYDQYAVAAFEVEAVDYLLKPFDDQRFAEALARGKQRARAAAGGGGGEGREALRRLVIQHQGRVDLLDVAGLDWVEAADQYVRLHARDGAEHLMRVSMARLEQELEPHGFLRVHRSALVRLTRVAHLERSSGGTGEIQLNDAAGTRLPVSRNRMAELRRRLSEG